jgi:cation diffusion facilitator CzcD-associated flavoprotein CzcO
MGPSAHRGPADPDVLDVLIIGAGVAGIHQLYELRRRDRNVQVVDAAEGIGGTWFWNRYPGCRFDSESYTYGYFFSEELFKEWEWSEHFAGQPETERYLNHVVDRFDLRPHIRLGTRVDAARFDETDGLWEVSTGDGSLIRTKFIVTAVGRLSAPQYPNVPGREDFTGEAYHTGLWPQKPVDFDGKRVAVIGVGSSGIQIATAIAPVVGSLTIFQSTPNWCAPLRNSPITEAEQRRIKDQYLEIQKTCESTFAGFIHQFEPGSAFDHTPEQRRAFFEEIWARPGFTKMLANYREVLTNRELNAEFCAFFADKIRAQVKDPAVAEMLIPKDHPYGAKRPPHEEGYYEIFNQDNVTLVDVKATPMVRFTSTGITTSERDFEFDIIVYATGFDALTGAFDLIDISAGGHRLKETWREGPTTYLGIQSPGFPNLFFLGGPQSGGGNAPRCLEPQVKFVTKLIDHAFATGRTRVDVTPEAGEAWTDHVLATVAGSLGGESKKDWAYGSNTPGKKVVYRSYAGGLMTYLAKIADVEAADYDGFVLTP